MRSDELPDVRPGDEWRDNDQRLHGRDDGRRFMVRTVTNLGVGGFWRYPSGKDGHFRVMMRRRFRPNSTGYVLVSRPNTERGKR